MPSSDVLSGSSHDNALIVRDVLQAALGTRLAEGRPGDLLRCTGRDLLRIVFTSPIRVGGIFLNA